MSQPKYIVHYFPLYGRGESVRQVLVLAGQEFEDHFVEMKDWLSCKGKFPFGQMPVLEEDGKQLAQEYAIARYLGRKFGLAGKTDWEQAQVDALADQFKDLFGEIDRYYGVAMRKFLPQDVGDADQLLVDVWQPAVKKHMPFFVDAIERSGSGFLVSSGVTWVDLMIAEWINTFAKTRPELLDDYPAIKAHRDKVHAIPRIKQYREKRPERIL